MNKIEYRELYAPAHFGNSYEVMYPREMRQMLSEAQFWGLNAYGDWFDNADLRNPADNPNEWLTAQAMHDRKISHFRTAGELGLKRTLVIVPNHVYIDQLRDELLAETSDDRYFGQLICPSKPEARRIILDNHRYLFQMLRENGIHIDAMSCSAYDYGGCSCRACAPWIVTYGKLCLEILAIAEEFFPGVSPRLFGWWWTDEDYREFKAWADREAPGKFESITRWIQYGQTAPDMSQQTPEGCKSYAFVHIGYSDVTEPMDHYGAWGPTIAAKRLDETIRQLRRDGISGYAAYSEGVLDDINKALVLGLASDRFADPQEVLEAYAERYFDAGNAERHGWAQWIAQWGDAHKVDTVAARRDFDCLARGARRSWRLDQLESKLRLFEAHRDVLQHSDWNDQRLAAAERFFAEGEHLQRKIWGLGLVRHCINDRFHRPDWFDEWQKAQGPAASTIKQYKIGPKM